MPETISSWLILSPEAENSKPTMGAGLVDRAKGNDQARNLFCPTFRAALLGSSAFDQCSKCPILPGFHLNEDEDKSCRCRFVQEPHPWWLVPRMRILKSETNPMPDCCRPPILIRRHVKVTDGRWVSNTTTYSVCHYCLEEKYLVHGPVLTAAVL